MSLEQDSVTPEALDAAIRILYKSRPAKAAALMGLIDTSEGSTLEPKVAAYASATGFPSPLNQQGTMGTGPGSLPIQPKARSQGDEAKVVGKVDKVDGISPQLSARSVPTQSIVQGQNYDGQTGRTVTGSLRARYKHAMSEQDMLAYYGGAGNLMEATGDPSLTPTQMATLGVGGAGVAGANRMRAKNVAGRDLRNVRQQYLQAVQAGALDKQQLKHLNRELKLRGAKPTLSLAPTVGIADAQMAKAEQGLTSKVLKKRYKGAIPLIAASLLGTLAYNQLS